jgi:GNAT superfamily N-acetyltransferase
VSFELRPATPQDSEQIVDLQIAAWRSAFLPLLPEDFEMPPRAQFLVMGQRAFEEPGVGRIVATAGGHVVGLVTHGPSRDEGAPSGVGEVRALFVHPDTWRAGIGTALVTSALDRLAEEGFAEVTLWSFRANEHANAFYERQGFVRDGTSQAREAFAGTVEMRYRRPL